MATLYELTGDMLALLGEAEQGEIDEQCLKDTLEGLDYEFDLKVESYVKVIKELESQSASVSAEIDRLASRQATLSKNITKIKDTLKMAMCVLNKPKVKTALFSVSVSKTAPKLVIDNKEEIPEEYFIPQPAKVNNTAIKNLLKENVELSYAHLEQGDCLRIR